MKDSIARARQIRTAEQTQAEVAEIRKQLDRIEDKLDRLLAASTKAGKKHAASPALPSNLANHDLADRQVRQAAQLDRQARQEQANNEKAGA